MCHEAEGLQIIVGQHTLPRCCSAVVKNNDCSHLHIQGYTLWLMHGHQQFINAVGAAGIHLYRTFGPS